MSMSIEISFSKTAKTSGGLVIALGSLAEPVSAAARSVDSAGQLDKAVKVAGFTGKNFSTADIIAPIDAQADRVWLEAGDLHRALQH